MTKARDLANFTAATGVVDADIGSTVQAYDSNLTSFVGAFTLPTSDGSNGQALITNGSGTVAFGSVDSLPSQSGNSGKFLTTDGSTASWAATGGAWNLLATITANGANLAEIDGYFSSTYDIYVIVAENIVPSANGEDIMVQYGTSGGYITTATYDKSYIGCDSLGNNLYGYAIGSTNLQLNSNGMGNNSGNSFYFTMQIINPLSTSLSKKVNWESCGNRSNDGYSQKAMGIGHNSGTAAITKIKFWLSGSATYTSGTFRLYGIANS